MGLEYKLDYSKVEITPEKLSDGDILDKRLPNGDRFSWKGKQLLDVLIEVVDKNLRIQYDNKRILKDDYAKAYVQLMQTVLQIASQLLLGNADLMLKIDQAQEEKKLTKLKQEQLRSQIKVHDRQLIGFDDNLMIKLLQAQLDNFSMIYSAGMLDDATLPDPINKSELADVYKRVKDRAREVKQFIVENRIVKPESEIIL